MEDLPADCWSHPDVEVRPSLIAGRGLFAAAPLPAGTEVAGLGGRPVDAAELRRLTSGEAYVDSVVLGADRHLVLPPGSTVHFANHSCDPTLGWTSRYSLVTLSDLPAGAELTCDYATSTADRDWLLRCHCPSRRCRQMIEGTDWQIPQLQQRYAGHWLPYLQTLIDAGRQSP